MPKVLDPETMTPKQARQQQRNRQQKERRARRELDAFYADDGPGGLTAFKESDEYRKVYGPQGGNDGD